MAKSTTEKEKEVSGPQFLGLKGLKNSRFDYFVKKKYGKELKTIKEWEKILIEDKIIEKK